LQGVWSCVLVLSATFDLLTDMLVFAAFIFYGAMAAGVFVLRRTMPAIQRPVKAIGYPILPAIFVLFCLALVVNTLIVQTEQSLYGLGLIASGIPFYIFWQSKRKAYILPNG
jgi:APA family basic amino acid/polyamine antiporter